MPTPADPHLLPIRAPDTSRLPSLDGLRAVSIAMVVGQHFISGIPGAPPFPGLFGVQIFFVVSGLLICRLLLAELAATGDISLREFYFRRALRLTPALFASVAAISVVEILFHAWDWRAAACGLAYATNYCVTEVGVMYAGGGGSFEGLWSLAVEEHFYLAFPLLLLIFFRRGQGAMSAVVAALCVAALLFRIRYALEDKPENFLAWRTESAFDFLLAGCALSLMTTTETGRRALRRVASTGALAAATIAFAAGQIASSAGKVELAIALGVAAGWIAVFVANALYNPDLSSVRAALNLPALKWLGRISYSLYLWHYLPGFVVSRVAPNGGVLIALMAIASSLVLAEASYRLIETPIMRRREKWARAMGLKKASAAPKTPPVA